MLLVKTFCNFLVVWIFGLFHWNLTFALTNTLVMHSILFKPLVTQLSYEYFRPVIHTFPCSVCKYIQNWKKKQIYLYIIYLNIYWRPFHGVNEAIRFNYVKLFEIIHLSNYYIGQRIFNIFVFLSINKHPFFKWRPLLVFPSSRQSIKITFICFQYSNTLSDCSICELYILS